MEIINKNNTESLNQKLFKSEMSNREYRKYLNDKKIEKSESPRNCKWLKEELYDLYYNKNLPLSEIGKMHNPSVRANTIKNWLYIFGIKKKRLIANDGESLWKKRIDGEITENKYRNYLIDNKKENNEIPKDCNWTREELYDLYYNQNLILIKIGKMHKPPVRGNIIRHWLYMFGIKKKTLVNDDGELLNQKRLKGEISGSEYQKLLNNNKRENGESPKGCMWSKEELEDLYALDKQNLSIKEIGKMHDPPVYGYTIVRWVYIFRIKKKTQCESNLGKNNGNWKGGISFEPYCEKFTLKVKEQVRNYWHRKCLLCNITEEKRCRKMSVHHVDYNKNQGCDSIEWKLISLCTICNSIVNSDRDYYENLFSNIIMIREILEEYNNKIDWRSIGLISIEEDEYVSFK